MWVLRPSWKLGQDMLAVDDVILSAYFEVMLTNDLNTSIILDELVVASIDIVIKRHFVQISLYKQ